MTSTNRRRILKSAFGALALAGAAQNGIAQTRLPRAGRGPRTDATTPDYARLSNAVLNSYGLAGGNVWTGSNTGTLKSDDLVRAAFAMRLTSDHFEEIGVNAYISTQLSKPPSGTISPSAIHTIGEQFRSYGILMTDAEIQETLFSRDPNTQQQALLYVNTLGVSGFQTKLADSIDLAAKKLRLLEIATACGGLLDQLSSSRSSMLAMQANALSPQASTQCQTTGVLLDASAVLTGYVTPGLVAAGPVGWITLGVLGVSWITASALNRSVC